MNITRRGLMLGACSVAAHPMLSQVTFAAAPGDARLVVIILRGAMDGLDVARPVGDPLYSKYRPKLAGDGIDLNGYFAMHPKLGDLEHLWRKGQLGFAHAVSTPYRDERSHFDGQDLLEAGTGMGNGAARGGWLNRMVAAIPKAEVNLAFGVGSDPLPVITGGRRVARWSPDVDVDLTPQAELLLRHIYAPDPVFATAADEGMALAATIEKSALPKLANGKRRDPVAAFTAERLRAETRIAAFSLSGWDTHQGQAKGINAALDKLSRSLLTLHEGLGAVWDKTLVLAVTEFGRTVAENGTAGTDHGTAGAMIMAGGALRGGTVMGTWPGLEESALYKRRDLMPTEDVRRYAAWGMHDLFGISSSTLERDVFPGLGMGTTPQLIL